MNTRVGLSVLALVVAAAHLVGCGCGVGAVPGPHIQNGVVTFDPVSVGASQELSIPFQDSANTDETITGATVTGPDAAEFEVMSTFPIPIPAGGQMAVEIRFAPTHEGSSTATVVLQTQGMGPSPVQIQGTGTAAGG